MLTLYLSIIYIVETYIFFILSCTILYEVIYMCMHYETFFGNRLGELRTQKGISAREMSLAIGQSVSYISGIENHKNFPSMTGFFYICEYLKIHPKDFFNDAIQNPKRYYEVEEKLQKLTSKQMEYIIPLLDDIIKGNRTYQ